MVFSTGVRRPAASTTSSGRLIVICSTSSTRIARRHGRSGKADTRDRQGSQLEHDASLSGGRMPCRSPVRLLQSRAAFGGKVLVVVEQAFQDAATAERAGFSIGTPYQHFPNRESVLDALIEREPDGSDRRIRAALAEIERAEIAETVRQIVRMLINSFARHRRVRKRFAILNHPACGHARGRDEARSDRGRRCRGVARCRRPHRPQTR